MTTTRTIPVATASGNYEVMVGAGLLRELGRRARAALGGKAHRFLLVADENVPVAMRAHAIDAMRGAGFSGSCLAIRAEERVKSLAVVESVIQACADGLLDRADVIVALGGGLTGDLAGFAAAIYRRGVHVIQCPTTLLSMVDASVGGKTGVNVCAHQGLLKNMAGVFHQPRLVLADLDTLSSLPERQFRSGLAECLKHGLLAADFGDSSLWDWTRDHMGSLGDLEVLGELIERNVRVKAAVVGDDERELRDDAGRAFLNLGHTFGHAIETWPSAAPDWPAAAPPGGSAPAAPGLLHGEAVAIGLHAAAACAVHAGLAPASLVEEVCEALQEARLPCRALGLPSDAEILARMRQDKKVVGGVPRLILPVPGGRSVVCAQVSEEAVRKAIGAIRAD